MTSRLLLGNDVNTFSVLQIRPVSATSFRQTSNLVKTLGLVWANGPQFHTISWDTVLSYPNKCTRVKVDSAHEMPYIGVYVCSVLTYLFRTVPCWPQGGLDDFTIGIFITQELQLIQGPKRSWKKITLKWRSRISVKEKKQNSYVSKGKWNHISPPMRDFPEILPVSHFPYETLPFGGPKLMFSVAIFSLPGLSEFVLYVSPKDSSKTRSKLQPKQGFGFQVVVKPTRSKNIQLGSFPQFWLYWCLAILWKVVHQLNTLKNCRV